MRNTSHRKAAVASKLSAMNRHSRKLELLNGHGRRAPASCGRIPRASGFTLIELMVTLTVAAILLGIAVPAFRASLMNDRLLTQASQLSTALYLGRAEAVKQDTPVLVCASADGATCSGAGTWETGWIVLSTAPGTTAPVQSVPSLSTGTTLRATGGASQVSFQSTGTMNAAASIGFKLCDSRGGTYARYLQVNVTGNVVAAPKVGFDLNNVALACP
jgi:type IV fimbrial biogenesis protein FimT